MAIDAWLLDQHLRDRQPSILRFYGWDPIALSLGYHQRQYPAHWQDLVWKGTPIGLVRRPTGGRAVLHQGDLTYAVVTSDLQGTRMQVYEQICEFLILGWRSLGVELVYGQAGRGYIHNPNCFGTATGADLVMGDGAKLVGSAQLRRGRAVLQHGSMQLQPDADLFYQVFGVRPVLPRLSLAVQGQPLVERVMDTLIQTAEGCFAVKFWVEPLSEEEWRQIGEFSARC